MSRHVPDARLSEIFTAVQDEFRRGATNDSRNPGYKEPIWVTVDARDLSPLLDELRIRRRASLPTPTPSYNMSNTTLVLIAMKVGESVEVEPISHERLTSMRKTARKRMQNPFAVWHRRTLPSGLVLITRMPDGTPRAAKHQSKMINFLSSLLPGHKLIVSVPKEAKRPFHAREVREARKVLCAPSATWTSRRLTETSFLITRTN